MIIKCTLKHILKFLFINKSTVTAKVVIVLNFDLTGADKSHCPTPGASAFSDRASEISLGACPWASDIS